MAKKKPLIERFQQLAGIKPLYEQETEKWGRWNLDTSTQAGKDIKKQSDSIPTVSSSEWIEIELEDLDFETLKSAFPSSYQKEKFTRPQTDEPYYEDAISFPNLDGKYITVTAESYEDWKDKVKRFFGNVKIVLKPYGKNWFDKVFVDDEAFNAARDEFIMGKMSALNR